MTAASPDRRQLLDAILRQDFYAFVQASFPIVSPGSPLMRNWHLEAVAHALTSVMRGELKRLIVAVPPRSLKSICASVAFPAYALGHDPTRRIVCVSYSEALARKHANDCRALMRSSLYRRLFPMTRIDAAKDSEMEVMTTARGFRLAASVGGTLTGRGGGLVVLDDPLKPQDAHSEAARGSLKQWYANTLLPRLDNKADDAIVVVMQRLHVDDLVGHLLEQGGWTALVLPAIAETEQIVPLASGRRHVRGTDEVLHPAREPLTVLQEIKASMGSADFAAQYQQAPVPPGGNLIDWAWLSAYDAAPAWAPGDRVIVSWDTAMSARELADYSACVVLQARGDTAYLLDVVRARLAFPQLRRKAIELHQRWRRTGGYALLIEDRGSGTSLIQDLKTGGIRALAIKPKGDKVLRMNAHTARLEAGALRVPRRAPWLEDFRRELLAFPHGAHDDQVDALSQALDRAFTSRGQVHVGTVTGLY